MTMVVHVGAKAPRFDVEGVLLDGTQAAPRRVSLTIDETRKALVGAGVDWPLDQIREVPDQAGRDLILLRLTGDPVARLVLTDDSIRARLPERTTPAPFVRRGRLVAWACAALASVALILTVLVPLMADQLADTLPPEGERALGQVTLAQIRTALTEPGGAPVPFCTAPEGLRALAAIETRLLQSTDQPLELTVRVLDHDMVNAFALPGGHIVFARGLIEAAGKPEEVAAVFAHEIGHVVNKDPTRHALRSAGSIGVLGLLFGDFAGGALMLFLAESLIEAQYSQSAEATADVFAHDLMRAAQLSPAALADFFADSVGDEPHDGIVQHFLSHPAPQDRIAAARAAEPSGFVHWRMMDDKGWQALRAICSQTSPD